jgi:hypothetical protein
MAVIGNFLAEAVSAALYERDRSSGLILLETAGKWRLAINARVL